MTEVNAQTRVRPQHRLAITVADPDTGLYPNREDNPNTYWIVFVDGSYTPQPGSQDHVIQLRQLENKPRAVAHNVVEGYDGYVPQGTLLEVSWHNRQWWFQFGGEAGYFQLLTDIGGNSHGALANPGALNTNTFLLNDPHDGAKDPAHTVVVMDPGGRVGAWIGDWVEAVATGGTMEIDGYEGAFPVYELTARLSAQTVYKGALLEELVYGAEGTGSAEVQLSINGSNRTGLQSLVYTAETWQVIEYTLYAWDWLLQEGESMPADTPVFAAYLGDAQKFYVTDTPCATAYAII